MDVKQHRFAAHAFAESFRMVDVAGRLDATPGLTAPKDSAYRPTDEGGIYAFNFGAVAFWNVSAADQERELAKLIEPADTEHRTTGFREEFVIEEDPNAKPHVEFNKLVVDRLTLERAEVVAFTVAQSAAMEYYESLVARIWSDVAQLVKGMRTKGYVVQRPRRLLRAIGEVITMRNSVVTVLHMLDRPDLIWNDPTMDSLYGDLRAVFDLPERLQAIQYKLATIQDTLEILIDASRNSRMFMVELSIVLLITFEIGLYFLERL